VTAPTHVDKDAVVTVAYTSLGSVMRVSAATRAGYDEVSIVEMRFDG
jgi:hypothetical protein